MLFVQSLWAYTPYENFVFGAVFTRGVILDSNGNATYVAYDDEGEEVGGHNLPYPVSKKERQSTQVIAKAQAYAITKHFKQLQKELPDLEVLEGIAYDALPSLPNMPLRKSYINFVVVRGAAQRQLMIDGSQLVLQQSILDPRGQYGSSCQRDNDVIDLTKSCGSLLVNKKGNVIASSEGSIGLRTSFLKDAQNNPVYDSRLISSRWRQRDYTLVSPLKNLPVSSRAWNRYATLTDEDGKFSMRYRLYCPGFAYPWIISVNAELRYSRFNPRGQIWATYFYTKYKYDYCSGISESLAGSGTLLGQMVRISIMAIEATMAHPVYPQDMPIDIVILDGAASFGEVSSGDKTRYNDSKSSLLRTVQNAEDFDNDGTIDRVETGKFVTTTNDAGEEVKSFEAVPLDQGPEFQAIWLSRHHDLATLDVTKTLPSYTRLLDWSDDFDDRALLSKINKKDLQNTDIYLIRESDGTLITERRGLKDEEAGPVGNLSVWDGEIKYTMQIVNSHEAQNRYGYSSFSFFRLGNDFESWQVKGNMNPKFYKKEANHLKIGEMVRIVAINRATGYMGSVRTEVKGAGGEGISTLLSFHIPKIEMLPPNLKVWARRQSDVGTKRGEDGIQQIGSEGAALSNDKIIVISTEWLDHDGSPLPAVLDDFGFTGRLARVSGEHTLETKKGVAGGNNSLSNFAIKPGRQTQVIKLAEGNLGTEHLYVHVSGEPQKRRPDLSSGLTEGFAGNFNNDPGKYAEGSILKYRPSLFVPVKVAVFDENSTKQSTKQWKEAKKNNPSLEKPEPTYRWVYRPEFQFSVYDLDINEIIRTPDQGEEVDIYISETPAISASDDTLKLLFDLTESTYNGLSNVLDAYSYNNDRELVFDLAGQELIATIGSDKTITFDNLDYLAALQSEDLLTIRLFSNNDAANVLWEYDFTPIQINIAVDFNRDGKIEFTENDDKTDDEKLNDKDGNRTDYVTDEKPYVFWVNDDDDDFRYETKGHDISTSGGNNKDFVINGSRDLIDFFAIAVDLHDILNNIDTEGYTFALRQKDSAVNVVYSAMDMDNSDAYLNELVMGSAEPIFGNGRKSLPFVKKITGDDGGSNVMPKWFLELLKEDEKKGVVMVEITKETTEPLELVVYKDAKEVLKKELPLRGVNVKQLYVDVSLRTINSEKTSSKWSEIGESPSSAPDVSSITTVWNFKKTNTLKVANDTIDPSKNFIFLHGFKTDADAGVAFNNEIFKRLYHSGSNALYTGILWEGNQGALGVDLLSVLRYWKNNQNAFYTADDVAEFISKGINGEKTVAAHSMGNVVMGSAISNFGLIVNNYFMIDPAVALEAYDEAQLDPKKMRHTEWDRYYFGADDSYSQTDGRKLWSTEWYRLFSSNAEDHRNKLTWRDIFSPVVNNSNINVVQYYSSGEEVLQAATEGVPWSTDSLPYIGESGRNSWNISEKGKGNRQFAGNIFIGFGRAGWEFRKLSF